MFPNYYINDYLNLLEIPKEKEYMKTDIREYQNRYIMETDIPGGIKKENIFINYENGYLTIRIARDVSAKLESYIKKERFYGEIKRSFYIGSKREADIKATYSNSILTISFPKDDTLKNQSPNINIK